MTDSDAVAHLRQLAHRHVDSLLAAWPMMMELRYAPDVARPDPTDGATGPSGVHCDPTAAMATSHVDAGPGRSRANPAAAWLNEATATFMKLAELDEAKDEILGVRPASCAVCRRVLGRNVTPVDGCHRACYDARRKKKRQRETAA